MRGLRSTIAFAVILAGLSAYIYFVTWKTPADDGVPKVDKVFAAIEGDKIEDIHIKAPSGETTLKKSADGWQIVAPLETAADQSQVSGIATGLASLNRTRIVDENPTDLKEYGLAEPHIDIGFKVSGDKEYRRLLIGDKSPTGTDLFAKRSDEKRVVLIPINHESMFGESTFGLRDKTVLKFDRDKVDAIEVNAGGKPIQLAKVGTDWRVTKPIQARADSPAVDSLISRLQGLQMKTIETGEPSPADLKKYGLDKPQATLNLNAGSARTTLFLGSPAGENNSAVYARDASRPTVMTVESSLADDLKKGSDTYRHATVFEFRPYTATRLEITRSGQTAVFEKVKGQGDNAEDKWRRVSPNPADADKAKMESLLQKLADMRASSYVESTAKTGLDSPTMTIAAKFDEGKKEERVVFGKTDADAYAAVAGEPGAAKIDANELTEALKAIDEMSK